MSDVNDNPDVIAPVRVNNPIALLDRMVEKGTDPDALKKMMDLLERWNAHKAEAEFAEAMNECQRKMPLVVKNAVNEHTKKRYANLEAVNNVIKPVYTEAGFSIMFGEADSPLPGHVRIIGDAQHVGGHCKQYRIDVPLDGSGAKGGASSMNAIQAKGSTVSYAKRYLVCMIFNITVSDEDDDGAGGGPEGLNDAQTVTINELLADAREKCNDNKKFDEWLKTRFYKWIAESQKMPAGSVKDLNDVHAVSFQGIVEFLQKRIRGEK